MRRATSIQAFPRCVSPFTGQPLGTRQALCWSWEVEPWPNCSQNIIPLLNIPCLDFPLKTELVGIIVHFSINWISVFLIPSNLMLFSAAGSRTCWRRHRRILPLLSGQRSIHSQSPELFSYIGRPQRPSRWGQGPGKQSCGNCGPSCQGNKVGASCHHRTNWLLCLSGLEDHSQWESWLQGRLLS